MNRKDRRAQAAQARKQKNGSSELPANAPLETRLQVELHQAIKRAVPDASPENFPHDHVIRGLGLVAAAFAVQSGVSEADFEKAMGDYFRGIRGALDGPAVS